MALLGAILLNAINFNTLILYGKIPWRVYYIVVHWPGTLSLAQGNTMW